MRAGTRVIFADFLGPSDLYDGLKEQLRREIAAVLRSPEESVILRRVVTQDERREVEVWIELSSEEQLYRWGATLAERLSASVRERFPVEAWVMFRIVPLSHAFLNGQPRARGGPSFE